MGFVFSGLFWGILVILIGVGIIINVFFDIKIPFGRIIFALIFIGIGVSVLVKGFGPQKSTDVIFNNSNINYQEGKNEYNILFSKGRVDLSQVTLNEETLKMEINVIFADGEIKINPDLPIQIKISSAFAGAHTPDGNNISFGDYNYRTKNFDKDKPYLDLEANVVFGAMYLFDKDKPEKPEE